MKDRLGWAYSLRHPWFAFWWWSMAWAPDRWKPYCLGIALGRTPHRVEP